MHTTGKMRRIGFSKASISMGAVIHGAALLAAHLIAGKWESRIAKFTTYGGFTVGAGFACKLLHQHETRREKEALGLIETAL
jgi:hypothetical protein